MSTCLPPKRFEPCYPSIYDGIRFHSWFHRLEERRQKLPDLEAARLDMVVDGFNQVFAAEKRNVDERELRDYIRFVAGNALPVTKTEQYVLDEAYQLYCKNRGEIKLRACLDRIAPYYGLKARAVFELWETCPKFYPTGYKTP